MAIAGVLISGLLAGRIHNFLIQGIVFLGSGYVLMIGTIQLRKHRFLQYARNSDFESIETEIIKLEKSLQSIRSIKFKTDDMLADPTSYPDVARGFWSGRSAYGWFLYSMTLLMIVSFLVGFLILLHVLHL